jgi:hypothetical protein
VAEQRQRERAGFVQAGVTLEASDGRLERAPIEGRGGGAQMPQVAEQARGGVGRQGPGALAAVGGAALAPARAVACECAEPGGGNAACLGLGKQHGIGEGAELPVEEQQERQLRVLRRAVAGLAGGAARACAPTVDAAELDGRAVRPAAPVAGLEREALT